MGKIVRALDLVFNSWAYNIIMFVSAIALAILFLAVGELLAGLAFVFFSVLGVYNLIEVYLDKNSVKRQYLPGEVMETEVARVEFKQKTNVELKK